MTGQKAAVRCSGLETGRPAAPVTRHADLDRAVRAPRRPYLVLP